MSAAKPGRTGPGLPVSVSLTLLVAVVLIPALAFGALVLDRYASAERARNAAAVENSASRTADAIDRELAGMIATLNALAASPALTEGNMAAFATQAAAPAQGRILVVTAPDGRELFRSAGPPHATSWTPGPHGPAASDLLTDGQAQFVRLTVRRTIDPPMTLSFDLPAPVLLGILRALKPSPEWTVALIDGRRILISRDPEAERYIGKPATADFQRYAVDDQGSYTGTNLAGVPAISGYARMHLADWRIVAGAPLEVVERPLRRALLLLSGGGLLLACAALALAIRFARQISGPLRELAGAGAILGRGEVLGPVRTRVAEVASVASALRSASMALRQRSEALAAERTRLATIIETVPVGLLIVTNDMNVVSGNSQMSEILGRPAGGGRLALDLRMADGSAIPPAAWPTNRALRGEANPELECRLLRPDGSALWVYLIAAPIHDRDDNVSAAVVAALDIEEVVRARHETERSAILLEQLVAERTRQLEDANGRLREEITSRTQAEEQLRQVQKMEAVGQLTGGIAHDFNNLLTVVIGCLDMLRQRVPDERSRRLADSAMDGAQRAATLTARLLAFSRQQSLLPRALDPNELVLGMADLLRRTLGEAVQLETRLDPGVWPVHADPNQLENVLLNLAVNAKDAIRSLGGTARGHLAVATSNVTLALGAFVDVAAGDYVRIAVSDTGAGVAPDVIGRVFEPFFTTKPVGQGTGLGLSQVHGFVKQSGGHVEIASRTVPDPAHGTTVAIYLLREPEAARPAVPGPAVPPPASRPERQTILVVEDEPAVRRLACDALADLGYTVAETGTVAGALALLDGHPELALLFTDMVLPDSTGRTLADAARRLRPGLPILFTTGHTDDAVLREGRLGPGERLLPKPYTVQKLAESIAALLG